MITVNTGNGKMKKYFIVDKHNISCKCVLHASMNIDLHTEDYIHISLLLKNSSMIKISTRIGQNIQSLSEQLLQEQIGCSQLHCSVSG